MLTLRCGLSNGLSHRQIWLWVSAWTFKNSIFGWAVSSSCCASWCQESRSLVVDKAYWYVWWCSLLPQWFHDKSAIQWHNGGNTLHKQGSTSPLLTTFTRYARWSMHSTSTTPPSTSHHGWIALISWWTLGWISSAQGSCLFPGSPICLVTNTTQLPMETRGSWSCGKSRLLRGRIGQGSWMVHLPSRQSGRRRGSPTPLSSLWIWLS